MKIKDLIIPRIVHRTAKRLMEAEAEYDPVEERAYVHQNMRNFQVKDPRDGQLILTDTDLATIAQVDYRARMDGDPFQGFQMQHLMVMARMFLKHPDLAKIPEYAESFDAVADLYDTHYPEYDFIRDVAPDGSMVHLVGSDEEIEGFDHLEPTPRPLMN